MDKQLGLYNWLRQDEILGYIINAHAGVEPAPTNPAVMRRVFLWEDSGEIKMGNTEAFILHLGSRFEREVKTHDASDLHKLLRDLGESITPHQRHSRPKADSPACGRFNQPEPDEWVVSRSKSETQKD